ncbi:hypothetical protein FD51_GL000481 [Lacticaseibacillus zeae DSM 20178 = KCTC 3804]|uniref:Uncharacterized protein n=2 Tax=Lacticaseibacillus zeae TaxID=57037 RepID=A0A0R1EWS5_LACZE|nr:hypothetical protein FD51_GL000481 [Lacticaseibacillus zeae DSM 20178 = KCTC 3804]
MTLLAKSIINTLADKQWSVETGEAQMTRKKLKKLGSDERFTFQATYAGIGMKRTMRGKINTRFLPTILFEHVMLGDQEVTDHLWLNYTKQFAELGLLTKGEIIQFNARVHRYKKGYAEAKVTDYGLQRPTKVSIIKSLTEDRAKLPPLPDEKNALIGLIMKTNKDSYLKSGRGFDQWYVDQYEAWLRTESNLTKY